LAEKRADRHLHGFVGLPTQDRGIDLIAVAEAAPAVARVG
jgi:hypothetical protein